MCDYNGLGFFLTFVPGFKSTELLQLINDFR
jgi:hypothetical protein